MTIKLITGLPGSGKSLSAVELIEAERAKLSPRPIFVCGLDGYRGEGVKALDDPLQWAQCPDGSLVVVDEAQKWFPKEGAEGPVPPVRELSEHRHRGFDFVLITQHPHMVSIYLRKLVGEHVHVLRRFGTRNCTRITWGECVGDPQSLSMRARGVSSLWRYDPKLFALYQSATLHTVKRRVPLRLILMIPALLGAIGIFWWLLHGGFHVGRSKPEAIAVVPSPGGSSVATTAASPPRTAAGVAGGGRGVITAEEWLLAQTPRVEGIPWSAPIFDGLTASEIPKVFCMLTEHHGCKCFTEQSTRLQVREAICEVIARDGIYQPYLHTSPGAGGQSATLKG